MSGSLACVEGRLVGKEKRASIYQFCHCIKPCYICILIVHAVVLHPRRTHWS